MITATSGLALFLGLSTLGRGVWLLGGLLPLFVGLGMVLIYFLTLGTGGGRDPDGKTETSTDPAEDEAFVPDAGQASPSERFRQN